MRKVVVIGAGAAGMMAAISQQSTAHIQLCWSIKTGWERRSFPPGTEDAILQILYRHLSVIAVMILSFRGGSSHSLMRKRQWRFFQNIGVYAKNRNGYLYPNSDQAGAVLDSLRMEMERLCVEVHTETEVLEIIPKKNRFVIRTGNGNVTADRVILAAGSKAAPVTGSDGSGYAIAKKNGTPDRPGTSGVGTA